MKLRRFRHRDEDTGQRTLAFALAFALGAATGGLVWVGYRATNEWEHSLRMLEERRAEETVARFAAAISRDMRGAQLSVLVPINHAALELDPPYDLADMFARAFARFLYPESFFAWKRGPDQGLTVFFNRANRPPAWAPGPATSRDSVLIQQNPAAVRELVAVARRHAAHRTPFALFEARVGTVQYQTVVHLLYDGTEKDELYGLVGFTVNLAWVRRDYFSELTTRAARIGGEAGSMSLAIVDDTGRVVASTGPPQLIGPAKQRTFPFIFFAPALFSSRPTDEGRVALWTARVTPSPSPALSSPSTGAHRTLGFLSLAALATLVALLLTACTVRRAAQLAAIRSEFVSAVTHELKTPLASIRLVGETLKKGRYRSVETVGDYASLLSHQAKRLTMLVDNLLMYSRLVNVKQLYNFEPLRIGDLVEEAVDTFHPVLIELGFDVRVDVATDLPAVRGDRPTMLLVIENLIDNGLKYSNGQRSLAIRASANLDRVRLEVTDRGIGVSDEEIPKLFERHYRARNASKQGSGLGLAIARRIVGDHGGHIAIRSERGFGTTVTVTLPGERRSCANGS